jgi:hypothetical protein
MVSANNSNSHKKWAFIFDANHVKQGRQKMPIFHRPCLRRLTQKIMWDLEKITGTTCNSANFHSKPYCGTTSIRALLFPITASSHATTPL